MRRRSAGAGMSTSSISWARRTTSSGTFSCCGTLVIFSTTSFRDSRCWMFTAVTTSIPAASNSSMSCHRLALRPPGTFECANSSTSATWGRLLQHRVEVHFLELTAPVGALGAGQHLQTSEFGQGVRALVALDVRHHNIGAAVRAPPGLVQHPVGLAHPGGGPEKDFQPTRPAGFLPSGRNLGLHHHSTRLLTPYARPGLPGRPGAPGRDVCFRSSPEMVRQGRRTCGH